MHKFYIVCRICNHTCSKVHIKLIFEDFSESILSNASYMYFYQMITEKTVYFQLNIMIQVSNTKKAWNKLTIFLVCSWFKIDIL